MKRLSPTTCRGLVGSLVGLFAPALAQSSNQPSAMTHDVIALDCIEMVSTPAIDPVKTQAEDLEREARGLAPRFAIVNEVLISPQTHGAWEPLDANTLMWRLRISSPDAVSINLGFSRFFLPEGATLFLYSADMNHVIRPFTYLDNEEHGQLWSPIIPGSEIVVELTVPADVQDRVELEIGSINHGYRGFGAAAPGARSGSCNVDVICPEGDDWRNEIPAIAVISTGGSTFCTGFMVNNTAYDLTPYFMTANHCGIHSGNAASLVAYWNYENSFCRPPGSPASGGPGDGVLNQFNTGSFFRASGGASDFTLVELDDDPDPSFMVSYAGWDNSGADATMAIAIHHPNTDEKRISFENDPTTVTSYLQNAVPGDGTHVRVTDWDLGTTEPGSSGSPLFNQDHRVIGQLHGGYASCTSQTSDWYGRFAFSWNAGLSTWLDPGNTGLTTVDTISGLGMVVTPAGEVLHVGVAGGPFTNPSVQYTLTNPTPNLIDYQVSLTNSFGILLDGGTSTLSGSLAALGGSTTVTVSLGPDIDALPDGVYTEDVVFADLTNASDKVRTHIVEVGQVGFTTVPADGFETGGPVGGPFTATKAYTLTSTRPTPVTIDVATSDSWISLNGGPGPLAVVLSGVGDSAVVTVGISADANPLPAGIVTGSVSFTTLQSGSGNTSRPVVLDVGRFTYASEDTPMPINDFSTIVSTISVTDAYCIGDVNVEVDITHTYIGDLIVEVQSPEGTVVRLHNRTGGSTDNIVETYDDSTNPPDGPGLLADFIGETVSGDWTLTVSDNAGLDTGSLNSWTLRIASTGDPSCAPVAEDLNVNVPQDTTSLIVLQASSPVGARLDYVILTLPIHGALDDPGSGPIVSVPHTLAFNSSRLLYTPAAGYAGADGFDYKANAGLDSNIASVSIWVGPPPTADCDGNGMVNLVDFATFTTCFGLSAPGGACDAAEFACSDLDASGTVDLVDFASFSLQFNG